MRNAYGLAAAILAASMVSSMGAEPIYAETRRQKNERKHRPTSPNDHGPVIDTTLESKRARRRRLAKAASTAPGVHVHGGMPDDPKTSHALTNLIGRAKDRLDAMTPAEREEMYARQRENYARGMAATCEHGFIDFEQCPKCRETALKSFERWQPS